MKKTLVYVGGSKGGTGKSLVCMGAIDFLRKNAPNDEILLFETDSTNPDVGRLYKKTKGVVVENLALNENEENWTNFVDLIEQSTAPYVLVNSMAGANIGIESQGYFLNEAIEEEVIEVDFKTIWVMNKDKDSVDLLREYMERVKYSSIYPVKNLWFGKEIDFSYYNDSKEGKAIRDMVMKRGGRDFVFPVLNQKLTHRLYTQQDNFDAIREFISGGMRISLTHWLSLIKEMFGIIFGIGEPLLSNHPLEKNILQKPIIQH
ncbi:MAG: hypothetical protein LBG04_00190 [Holosporaceae bacterium]|jgi:glutaredoxin|nr:hypothetical protein [Holosporaceae bacterium]